MHKPIFPIDVCIQRLLGDINILNELRSISSEKESQHAILHSKAARKRLEMFSEMIRAFTLTYRALSSYFSSLSLSPPLSLLFLSMHRLVIRQ